MSEHTPESGISRRAMLGTMGKAAAASVVLPPVLRAAILPARAAATATVNGVATTVYRANVAYKAVRLEPGENVVHFRFQSRLMSVLSALAAVNAGVWLIGTGVMMVGMLKR